MSDLKYHKGNFPVTEHVASKILSLPMYAELTIEAIETVVRVIKDFYSS